MSSWIEIIGFVGSFLTVVTYLTQRMVQLRLIDCEQPVLRMLWHPDRKPAADLHGGSAPAVNAWRLYQIAREET